MYNNSYLVKNMEKKLICIFVSILMFAPFVSAGEKQESIVTKSVNSLENCIGMDNVNLMETYSIGRKTAYACVMTEITPGFYQFDLNNPGQMTLISALIGEPYAGTWANNIWYIITYPNNYLYKVDPETGTIVFIGSTSVSTSLVVTGMAYDDSSGKMFGCWVDLIPNNVIFYQMN